jgi:hypothetical protein
MKRRWFQIRLSTAIVMMLVASLLLWINVRQRTIVKRQMFAPMILVNGWPVGGRIDREGHVFVYIPESIISARDAKSYKSYSGSTFELILVWIVPNALCGIAMTAAAGFGVERLIRRRERFSRHVD